MKTYKFLSVFCLTTLFIFTGCANKVELKKDSGPAEFVTEKKIAEEWINTNNIQNEYTKRLNLPYRNIDESIYQEYNLVPKDELSKYNIKLTKREEALEEWCNDLLLLEIRGSDLGCKNRFINPNQNNKVIFEYAYKDHNGADSDAKIINLGKNIFIIHYWDLGDSGWKENSIYDLKKGEIGERLKINGHFTFIYYYDLDNDGVRELISEKQMYLLKDGTVKEYLEFFRPYGTGVVLLNKIEIYNKTANSFEKVGTSYSLKD
ncbi:MAG: hypothetical protein NTX32_06595 [Candidatus Firestonebacteria bacterium]|nr:hypothetical protein [Candidatus Firestonebacteria bacterium]